MIKRLKNIDLDNVLYIYIPSLFVAAVVGLLLFVLTANLLFGLYPFGPKSSETITVQRLYVDSGYKSSHYMVGTDKGVFEMDDSLILGIYNIDELYSELETGKTYEVELKGNKMVTWYCTDYPHIISFKEVK